MLKQVVILGALVIVLSSCTNDRLRVNDRLETIDSDFGNSVRQNIAVQTINPDAGGPDDSDSLDGQSAQQAVDRLRARSPDVEDTQILQNVGGN